MAVTTHFLPHGALFEDLRLQVEAAVAKEPSPAPRLALKVGVVVTWFVGSWAWLVFATHTWWQAALAAVSLGLAMAAIGFNVMHDGGHRAASSRAWVNRCLALGLDVLGGSSYIWQWKHNVFHHTNPNVVGLDTDIDIEPLVRLSPLHRWRPWHRFQHLYVWGLYALLAMKWHFIDDFHDVALGVVGNQPVARPRGLDLFFFVAGKLFFFTWAFAVPLLFHPVSHVLAMYVLVTTTVGLSLAITFQAAHCVDEAHFPLPTDKPVEWAEFQVRTSVDFAPGHWLWTWLLGGLNYQTEHHLFPRLTHVQLASIAPVVRKVCGAHGVTAQVLPSFGAAVASHVRLLRRMGQQPIGAVSSPSSISLPAAGAVQPATVQARETPRPSGSSTAPGS